MESGAILVSEKPICKRSARQLTGNSGSLYTMAFNFFCRHKLEELAGELTDRVYAVPAAPDISAEQLLTPQLVIVQTRGMAEYLRQFISGRCRIAVNIEMPFMKNFVNRTLRSIYGSEFREAELRSDPVNMRREIMKLLCDNEFVQNQLPELQGYIKGANPELKRWQLSGRIAELFDQYQLYRSSDVNKLFTQHDISGSWQQRIYCQLFNEQSPGQDHFFRKFLTGRLSAVQLRSLPAEISVFGVGTLVGAYLDFFLKLSEYCHVNFFYLSACMEYWEYQMSRRELKNIDPAALPEAGNPILQNLGRQGREFFSQLMSRDRIACTLEYEAVSPEDYPPDSSMLQIMQFDILHAFDRRESSGTVDEPDVHGCPRTDLAGDGSITIHNCHSLRRELEVLHDELIKIIQGGTDPRNILVMAPDIVRSAPIINAIFGNGPLRDVYTIADLPPASHTMLKESFHRILAAAGGRFEFSEIMSLLDLPLLAEALELQEGDLSYLSEYLQQSGARWGFDGAMHEKFCSSNFEDFSFRSAFDRLLLGFAHRSGPGQLPLQLNGCSALEGIDNSKIELLSKVIIFTEKLAQLGQKISNPHSVGSWAEIFESILKDFFADSNLLRTAQSPLQAALNALKSMAQADCAPGTYPLNAALAMLDDHWSDESENGRFLRGKITFCRMMPMRSIPMQVVAILDLNEKDFPRRDERCSFDLIAAEPLPGDHSLAVQDRYLLLEALLAPRYRLLLFYQGRDARNNQERPPCAPLAEIAGYLQRAFGLQEVQHKVSGIDPFYYQENAPHASCDQENFQALSEMLQNSVPKVSKPDFPEYFTGPAAALADSAEIKLTLEDLSSFFSNPARWFMHHQLGIRNNYQPVAAENDEPWQLPRKEYWQLDKTLIEQYLAGVSDEQSIYRYVCGCNLLPPGTAGYRDFAARQSCVYSMPEHWKKLWPQLERRPVSCRIDDRRLLTGMVNMSADGRIVVGYDWKSFSAYTVWPVLLGCCMQALASQTAVGGEILNISTGGWEMRRIEPITPEEAAGQLRSWLELAERKFSYPPEIFPKASLYYQEPVLAQKKFYYYNYKAQEAYGDVTESSIQHFYCPEDWHKEDFQEHFQTFAQQLYGRIKIAEEPDDE